MPYEIVCPDLKDITYEVVTAGFTVLSPADATRLKVAKNDPLDMADFPFVGINLLSDSEAFAHIGDALADELLGLEDQVYAGCSTEFQQHVEVKLWCRNGDERDRLGKLLKIALFAGRGTDVNPGLFLTTDGVVLAKISGGVDEGISVTGETYPAHTVYTRTYFITATTELTLQENISEALKHVSVSGNYYAGNAFIPDVIP